MLSNLKMRFIVLLITFLIFLVLAFTTFDKLVKIQYRNFNGYWHQDGKPCGFFWYPKETSFFKGFNERNRLSINWLLKTPAWVKESPNALSAIQAYRIWIILSVLTWFLSIVTVIISNIKS
jgi:hypothetical protein